MSVINLDSYEERSTRPVFAGYTEDKQLVILYVRASGEFFLQRPDGEVWALSPKSEVNFVQSLEHSGDQLTVRSPEWTGIAYGDRKALFEAPHRNL